MRHNDVALAMARLLTMDHRQPGCFHDTHRHGHMLWSLYAQVDPSRRGSKSGQSTTVHVSAATDNLVGKYFHQRDRHSLFDGLGTNALVGVGAMRGMGHRPTRQSDRISFIRPHIRWKVTMDSTTLILQNIGPITLDRRTRDFRHL